MSTHDLRLLPADQPECCGDDCDGECEQAARDAFEADRDDRNDAIRKGEW